MVGGTETGRWTGRGQNWDGTTLTIPVKKRIKKRQVGVGEIRSSEFAAQVRQERYRAGAEGCCWMGSECQTFWRDAARAVGDVADEAGEQLTQDKREHSALWEAVVVLCPEGRTIGRV